MDESKRKAKDVDELRRLLDRSISPYELHVAKTPSASHLDRGDTREQDRISTSPSRGNNIFPEEDLAFGKEIEEICKIYDNPKKIRNSQQVFPFENDVGIVGNTHVAFYVESPPSRLESKPPKGSSVTRKFSKPAEGHHSQQVTASKKRKSKADMMVSGKSCASKLSMDEVSQSQEKGQQKLWRKDTLAESELKNSAEDHDREMEKLTKELQDANDILNNIELDIHYIKEQREISQQALNSIKATYRNLLEEKFMCQKQISYLRKELCSNRIKDKRVVREFEQLKLFYEKLDYKERSMRKQISLLEAEMSLVVQKLKIPVSRHVKRPIVPRLELSTLMQPRKLPPVKNPPPAPRKITEVIQVYDSKDSQTKKMKRCSWPQHSFSSSTVQKQKTRSIPSGHEKNNFYPLIGNQKPLTLRPDKKALKPQANAHLSEVQEHTGTVRHVLEENASSDPMFNVCIKSPKVPQEIDCRFLPKLQNRVSTT